MILSREYAIADFHESSLSTSLKFPRLPKSQSSDLPTPNFGRAHPEVAPTSPLRTPHGTPPALRTPSYPAPPTPARATGSLPHLHAPQSPTRAAESRVPTSPSGRTVQPPPSGFVGASRPTTRTDRTRPQRMTETLQSPTTAARAQRANRSPSSGTADPLPAPLKRNGL